MPTLKERFTALLPPGRLARNITTMTVGTIISQCAVMLANPLITRVYDPESFGGLALFTATVAILGLLATLRFDVAIPLPQDDDTALKLAILAVLSTISLTVLCSIMILLFGDTFVTLLKAPVLRPYLYLIPAGVLGTGLLTTLNYWTTRRKRFSTLTTSTIGGGLAGVAVQLLAGVTSRPGALGLIAGNLAGLCAALGTLIASTYREWPVGRLRSLTVPALSVTAQAYAAMPRYLLQTSFLNTVSRHALPLVMLAVFSPAITGLVVFAQRIMMLPARMIGGALWQVAHAEFGRLTADERARLFSRMHQAATILYAFPCVAFGLFAHHAGYVFGDAWAEMAAVLPAFAVLVYVNAVSNATSFFLAFGYYRAEAVANIALVLVSVGALLVAAHFCPPTLAVTIYALAVSVVYGGIMVFWGLKLRKLGELCANVLRAVLIALVLLVPVRLMVGGSFWWSLALTVVAGVLYYSVAWRRYRQERPTATADEATPSGIADTML